MKVTSCVSDSNVSRFERLCEATADGSGDVSVIREPVTGLLNLIFFRRDNLWNYVNRYNYIFMLLSFKYRSKEIIWE